MNKEKMNQTTKSFISKHLRDDVAKLAFKYNDFPELDLKLALRQIAGRQKIEKKVPHFYNQEEILYPQSLPLEQCSSQITAEYKASLCGGEKLIDLTGGFGIDSYFLSKNFDEIHYVEKNQELCELAEYNFHVLKAENIHVNNSSAEAFLNTISLVDWIYIDPSRRSNGKKVFLLSECEPDIIMIHESLLQKTQKVMIKLSPMLDISSAIKDLQYISDIHILAVSNECKEILLIMNKEKAEDIKVHAVNIKNNEKHLFSYSFCEEVESFANYTPTIKNYLYEPNAAIMKSGAFNTIANHYKLDKLHANTHLYTSEKHIEDFPGRIFKVARMYDSCKESFKKIQSNISKANITVRNYPDTVEALRKKLKLSSGGDCYLFACTLADNKRKIIECTKINNLEPFQILTK